jgi:hypothetical protein
MVWIEIIEKTAAERGLAAANLADQHDESLFLLHPVLQVLEGLLVGGAEIKETGIRRDVERHLAKPIKTLVHLGGKT